MRYPAHLPSRLQLEWVVLKKQLPFVALCFFVFGYLSTVLFRNLAFYRYRAGPRLKDLGYDVLPDWEHSELFLALENVPMNLSMWSMLLAALLSVWGNSRVYAINQLIRVLAVLSLGHTIRFFTYMSTTLPGTQEKCLPGHIEQMNPPQPKSMHDVFSRLALSPGNNCGDLMFSGHLLGIVTPVLMIHKYGPESIVLTGLLSERTFRAWMAVLWVCVVLQGVIIVGLRNHYTADVVVSAYVTPLLWTWYNGVLHPHDVEAEDVRAAATAQDELDEEEAAAVGRERWATVASSDLDAPLLRAPAL
jgi:hypothetical protein